MFHQIVLALSVIAVASADGCAELIAKYRATPVTYPFPYHHGPHQGEIRYELGPQFSSVYELVRFELGGKYAVEDGKVVLTNGNSAPLVLSPGAAEDQWGPSEGWQQRFAAQDSDANDDGFDWDDDGIDDELVDDFLRSYCLVTHEQ